MGANGAPRAQAVKSGGGGRAAIRAGATLYRLAESICGDHTPAHVMRPIFDSWGFFGQMVANWRQTGAIAPSSRALARAMATNIGPIGDGEIIIELGPGTGVFTRELIQRHPRHQVVAVEFNPVFAKRLRARLPRLIVVEGCASKLHDHLASLHIGPDRVGAVVSGLPLLNLPRGMSTDIFSAIATCLAPGKRYVQFTYSKHLWNRFMPMGFRAEPQRKVWLNMPPAVVMPFTRAA